MKEPTEAQVKKFWEWCGGLEYSRYDGKTYELCFPDGGIVKVTDKPDLNNLFKYAVPKLQPEVIKLVPVNDGITTYADKWGCILTPKGWGQHTSIICDSPDPALALFWAIWKQVANKEGDNELE